MTTPKDAKGDSKPSSPNTSSSSSSGKSANNQNIIKKPKRLRKQLNNREFKKFYFELVPNITPNAEEQTFVQQDSYEVKKFEASHSNDEEMRNAIKAQSSHFYLFDNKKEKKKQGNSNTLSVTCKETSQQTCQTASGFTTPSTTSYSTIQQQNKFKDSLQFDNRQEIQTSHVNNSILDTNKLMLNLDYDDIIDQLNNINSPYNQSLHHFNVK